MQAQWTGWWVACLSSALLSDAWCPITTCKSGSYRIASPVRDKHCDEHSHMHIHHHMAKGNVRFTSDCETKCVPDWSVLCKLWHLLFLWKDWSASFPLKGSVSIRAAPSSAVWFLVVRFAIVPRSEFGRPLFCWSDLTVENPQSPLPCMYHVNRSLYCFQNNNCPRVKKKKQQLSHLLSSAKIPSGRNLYNQANRVCQALRVACTWTSKFRTKAWNRERGRRHKNTPISKWKHGTHVYAQVTTALNVL
jgi:hypothetical protein